MRAAGPGRVGGGVHHLHLHPPALLERPPGLDGLAEQDAGVDREHAGGGLHVQQQVEQHRLLLLEGAGHDQPGMEPLDGLGQDVAGG